MTDTMEGMRPPKGNLRPLKERIKTNLHPLFLQAAVDELFSEHIEVSEYPEDRNILQSMQKHDEPGKYWALCQLENRRDKTKLKAVIQRQMQNYLKREKDSDEHLFKKNRLESIATYEAELCKDRHKYGKDKERSLFKDLEAYKEVLFDLVPDEVTPNERHPEKHYFTTTEAYEVFKFLADEYHNDDKVKWSVIKEFMKNMRIETHLSARKYLQWIQQHYQPEMKSLNLQNTTNDAHEVVTKVYKRYKNSPE